MNSQSFFHAFRYALYGQLVAIFVSLFLWMFLLGHFATLLYDVILVASLIAAIVVVWKRPWSALVFALFSVLGLIFAVPFTLAIPEIGWLLAVVQSCILRSRCGF